MNAVYHRCKKSWCKPTDGLGRLTPQKGVPMIRRQTAMTNSVPAAEAAGRLNSGKVAIGLLIACAISVFFYFDLGKYLSLDAVKENRDHLLAFAEANYAGAVAIFILTYIAVTALSLPGAAIMTLAGGFLF